MATTLFLLAYVTLFLPVIIVISYLWIKALQAPAVTPGRVNLSPEERKELLYWAFCLPWTITPFPSDTHHEQETNYTTTKS